jgi:alcohol dehydrogenase class IV
MSTGIENMHGNWGFPTTVRFGVGRIEELPDACRELGIERPLVVTDKGLAALAMIQDAVAMLSDAGLGAALFSDVQGNPVEANVVAGLDAYRQGGHDGIVAFGGGSAMDVGKCIALMVGQTRPIWDFEDREDWWTRADADGIAPVIAVPTTSGTGSEVGRAGVITNLEDHTKRIIFHPKMLPAIVIEDPRLTAGLPAHLTAAVGMDALSHNMEAYCSPLFHPMADGVALEGMRLIKNWLPAACADGNDLAARGNMQVASSMGATAFQKGLGAMHSLSHPCGSLLDTHHGLTDLANPSGKSVLDWVLALREQIGIHHTLAELGVSGDLIPRLARMAVDDPTAPTNPVKLTVANLEGLYTRAIQGELTA